jgi:hypothetical protein
MLSGRPGDGRGRPGARRNGRAARPCYRRRGASRAGRRGAHPTARSRRAWSSTPRGCTPIRSRPWPAASGTRYTRGGARSCSSTRSRGPVPARRRAAAAPLHQGRGPDAAPGRRDGRGTERRRAGGQATGGPDGRGDRGDPGEGGATAPVVPARRVREVGAGLRAATYAEDFVVGPTPEVDGFFHVAGMQSPGVASVPAVAELVVERLRRTASLAHPMLRSSSGPSVGLGAEARSPTKEETVAEHVLVIDEGTTGTRAVLVDRRARSWRRLQGVHPAQPGPRPGRARSRGDLERHQRRLRGSYGRARGAGHELAAVAISNQRATSVLWDRRTGEPVDRAIVWQDSRTAGYGGCPGARLG